MKTLIIDSHKGTSKLTRNLHLQNANIIAKSLSADLIWSYPDVNADIKGGYDVIIFNHASHYSYVDYAWLEASPDAKLFYITNEYNLGEPRALWMALKRGRKYQVIANHPPEPSKIVKKYVDKWHNVNLNALLMLQQFPVMPESMQKSGCVYWGSFRKDRVEYFKRYLGTGVVQISTHSKNIPKFQAEAIQGPFMRRVNWDKEGLHPWLYSLYIEDVTTHTHYNYLANRFYESIKFGVMPLFAIECTNTIEKSAYHIAEESLISSVGQIEYLMTKYNSENWKTILDSYRYTANIEADNSLKQIKEIVWQ